MARGGLGRGRRRRHLNAEVNIINLVDVVLVLLIIFMVTAPMMQNGIEVRLPKAVARPLNTAPTDLLVQVQSNGQVKVNNQIMSAAEFAEALPRLISAGNVKRVNYAGDGKATNDMEAPILGAIMKQGLPINLVLDPRAVR